ncbi:ribonuclease T2 family protein [Rhodovulum steppense]|uniref:Ribonuclease T2 n=1 Tax=Rhodovulum steppense TaxID=540251 RepID=A0A4R1YSR0_9RHOB|nr:ribonuclease T2 [Rhodovulum steppense]TCM82668.1 ribonuclease T2 [Rhodovulum steppense]
MRWLVLLILTATITRAAGEESGNFDYYVLSLSWSPTWCALEGDARGSPQCEPGTGHGWVLHGLWPQYERGWPSYCPTAEPGPTRAETRAMADIMGSAGLAWHQWNKHGRCSGLSTSEYYALSRRAYMAVNRPDAFRKLSDNVRLPAAVVEETFLQANPTWRPDMLTITCKAGRIQEARLCLTRDMKPRLCGDDVVEDCELRDAQMDPIR